jgi:predicted DCC family thiol-disulfide oxidoreductase YuxK
MKNKVFFNNSCNICRAEINHYKKHSNQDIEWIDVTSNIEAQQITAKSYEQLLRRMHVIQDGKLIEGAEVFLIIWRNIPKYNFLYKIFNKKNIGLLLNILYKKLYLGIFFQIIRNTSAPSISLPS